MRKFKINFGFTLVEILVVLGIMSGIILIGIVSYRDFNRRQQLVETAKSLQQDLQLAQQKALSGEKSACPSSGTNILLGYSITFTSSTYSIVLDCFTGSDPVVKTIPLPTDITKTTGASSITFKVLGQGTTDTIDSSVTLTQGSTGKTAVISVTRTGSISVSY